ncbi:hypothetical protein [Agrococcus jejuensis]|uniref:Lipoprotein n=1 Tax=Agrococcus jejuensis TaxID=399736 RepID=A0A1G8C3L1_9MICO|nr:hypothetical protein [Agrococcus jejuensis]SDH39560.1 hypothetical protein SAMN04489720_1139 [Agrococcus jejuensis]
MTRTASLAVAALALVALAGCATAAAPEASTSASPSATPAPSAEPTPSASEEPEGIDTSDWLEYSTHDGDMTYRYPADWTITSDAQFFDPDAERTDVQDRYQRWMDTATLTAPNGQQLLHSSDFVDVGGACGDAALPTLHVLATEPAAVRSIEGESVVIATLAMAWNDGTFSMGIGITGDHFDGQTMLPACMINFIFASSDGGVAMGTHFHLGSEDPLWNIASLDDATAYMETDEYATILEILRSVRTV